MLHRIVAVGASLAGLRAAETLRDRGFDGELPLLARSRIVPTTARHSRRDLFRKKDGYEALALDRRLGVRATSIDLGDKRATLAGGTFADYDRLIIATGARVRTLPGIAPRAGLLVLRNLDDAIAPRGESMQAARVAIVGAGVHRPRGRRLLPRTRAARHRHWVASCPPFPVPGQTLGERVTCLIRCVAEVRVRAALKCGR
jgi:NAD(P)H-nitrite reductase large subunit